MKTLKGLFLTLLFVVLSVNGCFAQAAPYHDSSASTIAVLLSIIISIIILALSIVVSYFVIKTAVKNAIIEASKTLGKDFVKQL